MSTIENNSYIVGSKMLGLSNCGDTDIVCYGNPGVKHTEGTQFIYKDLDALKLFLSKFDDPDSLAGHFNRPFCGHFYQHSKCFHPDVENYPIDWDVREHKEGWKKILKNHITHEEAEGYYILKEGVCRKTLYNIAYQYYMILRDTVWLNEEDLAIVQKIHDLQMPAEYFYILRDQILALE